MSNSEEAALRKSAYSSVDKGDGSPGAPKSEHNKYANMAKSAAPSSGAPDRGNSPYSSNSKKLMSGMSVKSPDLHRRNPRVLNH